MREKEELTSEECWIPEAEKAAGRCGSHVLLSGPGSQQSLWGLDTGTWRLQMTLGTLERIQHGGQMGTGDR